MQPDVELDFIRKLDADRKSLFSRPTWLLNEFDAKTWQISIDHKEPISIDWQVYLGEKLLTDEANSETLESFKYFLSIAVDSSEPGIEASPRKLRRNLSEAITIIDHMLMNADSLELSSAGLTGLSFANLTTLLHQFSTQPYSSESIYNYSARVEKFALELTASTPAWAIANTLQEYPSMRELALHDQEPSITSIHGELIPTIRAALFYHGYYSGSLGQGFHVNGTRLSKEIYRNTIGGVRIKPRLPWLSFFPYEKPYNREFEAVPVRYPGNGKISAATYNSFRSTLYRLGGLHSLKLPAPPVDEIKGILNFSVPLSEDSTFRSVPSDIVFGQFKSAVEFHFKYGKLIIDGFCRLAAHCKATNATMHQLPDSAVQEIIGTDLVALGVKQLGLACKQLDTNKFKPLKKDYFIRLRANEGLIELVQIYIGCVQFILGTLMARRYNELMELPLIECLDKTKEWLVVNLEKTSRNVFGARDTQARPIDPLAVNMIRLLIRFQRLLKRFGFIDNYKRLFATPSNIGYKGLIDASVESWNRNLNIIADYFETPQDKNGRRYYIRQHQLRRFFALMFFHTYGYGSLNAIRWMLGHQDIEHVYRYIRANVDGGSLRGALAQTVLEEMSRGRVENYRNLADLLKAKFGTENYSIYDSEEAEIYIQSKVANGSIIIEPEFFTDKGDKKMKLVVTIVEPHS